MHMLLKNEAQVLHSIFTNKSATRTAIAQDTNLSLVKISSLLNGLENRKYIIRKGKPESKGGRPSSIYQIVSDLGCSIGISLKVDILRIVASDCAKRLYFERTVNLDLPQAPETHREYIEEQISSVIQQALFHELRDHNVLSVGLALPGMVDTEQNLWLQSLQMTGINRMDMADILQSKLDSPVYVEDVARVLTFMEMICGQGQGIDNFVLLYSDFGLGAGIVLNRRLYRGYHGLAGEIGHIVHANNSYRCSCNNVGCLETVVSAPGILRIFRERLQEGVHSSLQQSHVEGEMDLDSILKAAQAGDRFAQTTLYEVGQFLGDACAILIKLFNPQRIIICGGVTIFQPYFEEPIRQILQQRVLGEMLEDFELRYSDYQPYHEAYGAALVALDRFLSEQ